MQVADILLILTNDISRFRDFKEQHERQQLSNPPADMDPGTMEDLGWSGQDSQVQGTTAGPSQDSKAVSFGVGEMEREDSERNKGTDETSHKNRSKRESRRMRELEQAQFSLELLKVRTTSVGGLLQEDSVPGSSTSQLDDECRHSPRGSPTSHGSFELLSVEDIETEGSQSTAPQKEPQALNVHRHEGMRDSNHNEKPVMEGPRATFYIASDQSPVHEPRLESPRKSYKERRETTSRRPVVVLISMQKESPVEEGELLAALGKASQTGAASTSLMTPIAGLEVKPQIKQPTGTSTPKEDKSSKVPPSSIHESSPEVSGICSSEVDIQIVLEPKLAVTSVQQEKKPIRSTQEAPSPVLDTKPPKAQKKSSGQTVIVNMVEKPSNAPVFSLPRRKLPFSK